MSSRLLVTMGAGLAERGYETVVACCRNSASDREIARRFPALQRRSIVGTNSLARGASLRGLVRSSRADVVLVANERDQLSAALAIGRAGGVLRRLAIGERYSASWRTRLAGARSRCLLFGDEVGPVVHTELHVRTAVSWPPQRAVVTGEPPLRLAPVVPPLVMAIVAGTATGAVGASEHAAGATALRAAARLLSRHPGLRVVLLGEVSSLQALRLHAASVGLVDSVSILPLDSLIEPGPFEAAGAWITASGDTGAVSILSAMMRRIPVIVPRGFDTEGLVAPRITGVVSDDTDLSGSVAALAQLLADTDEHHAVGAAAAARAERLHGWDAMMRRLEDALSRVAGRITSKRAAA
ncbi:MAG TPA: hypothetical protein VE869_04175 [Gemmatimonas sp.]|nr:hypothetical protein [Gemmatimonas sp.]